MYDNNRVHDLLGPILTSNFIMMKLASDEYNTKIRNNFELLEKLDPLRGEYYKTLLGTTIIK